MECSGRINPSIALGWAHIHPDGGRGPGKRPLAAALYGTLVGGLGGFGLIGLGGAEFRLPVLKAAFGYATHRAVALNLAVSLITLLASIAIRMPTTPWARLEPVISVMAGLISGSMGGAYLGASYASHISVERLERLIVVLLVAIGGLLVIEGLVPLRSLARREPASFGSSDRPDRGRDFSIERIATLHDVKLQDCTSPGFGEANLAEKAVVASWHERCKAKCRAPVTVPPPAVEQALFLLSV